MTTTAQPRARRTAAALVALGVLAALLTLPSGPAGAANLPGTSSDGTTSRVVGTCVASAGPSHLGLRCLTGRSGADTPQPSAFLCKPPNDKATPEAKLPPDPFDPSAGETQDPTTPEPDPEATPDPGKPKPEPKPKCEPVPKCYYVKMDQSEQSDLGKFDSEGREGVSYYWRRCLTGINPQREVVGKVDVVQYPVGIYNYQDKPGLLPGQSELIDAYVGPVQSAHTPPAPSPVASPSTRVRVGTDVSFFDSAATQQPFANEPPQGALTVRAGGVELRAVEEWVEVQPEGSGDPARTSPERCRREGSVDPNSGAFSVNADVGHQADKGETRASNPDGCWYRYKRSSAYEPDDLYHVGSTSHWRVWVRQGGGGWQPFGVEFNKTPVQPALLAVLEVQSINVLPVTGVQ